MNKQILVVDEVAELLRVDRQRIYELVRTNQLPVIRLGQRQYRFDSDAIHRWLNAGGSRETEASGEDDESNFVAQHASDTAGANLA
jgi:excisionase family DNA binding protein